MCRHLARLGSPVTLAAVVLDPPSSLRVQAYAPRRQAHGAVNADGYGVGWYDGSRAEPARIRRAQPIWTDASLASLAGVIVSRCVLAAVRTATAGMPVEATATAPFLSGRVLLSHNGRVDRDALAPLLTARLVRRLESVVDSAWLAALVFDRVEAGQPLQDAIASVVRDAAAADPVARLNLLGTDGASIVATAWGDTLAVRVTADSVTVASEPDDDDTRWTDVPDRTLVVVTPDGVAQRPLD